MNGGTGLRLTETAPGGLAGRGGCHFASHALSRTHTHTLSIVCWGAGSVGGHTTRGSIRIGGKHAARFNSRQLKPGAYAGRGASVACPRPPHPHAPVRQAGGVCEGGLGG